MIEIFFKTSKDPEFKQVDTFQPGCWICVSDAEKEDLDQLAKLANIKIEDLRDSLDMQEIPRIESQEDNLIIFARHPIQREYGLYTSTLTIILTSNYLITITPRKSHVIESILQYDLHQTTSEKKKLLFHILMRITQDYTNNIKKVRYRVLEQEMDTATLESNNIENEAIVVLTKNEEILNQFLTSLVPMRNLLDALLTDRYIKLHEHDFELLHDLSIAIKQSEDLCRVNVKSIRSLRDSYQILFTNDVNKTIKRLTAITIIFTIPTIIASVYGMNVELPFEKNPYSFLIIINAVIIVTLFSVLVFIRKRWL